MNPQIAGRAPLLVALALIGALCNRPLALAAPLSLKARPNKVEITESFTGEPVTISADLPKGAAAVFEFKGEAHHESLLRKGRRGGLWMTVGEVRTQGAPTVYLLMTSPTVPEAPTGTDPLWGYEALRKHVTFSGALPPGGPATLFDQFIRLKQRDGLYAVFPGALKTAPQQTGAATVRGTLMIPSNIPPAVYTMTLTALDGGKILDKASIEFPVEMQGLPALLAGLAHTNPTLYGLLAVVTAIAAGFIIGYVFKGKAAH